MYVHMDENICMKVLRSGRGLFVLVCLFVCVCALSHNILQETFHQAWAGGYREEEGQRVLNDV